MKKRRSVCVAMCSALAMACADRKPAPLAHDGGPSTDAATISAELAARLDQAAATWAAARPLCYSYRYDRVVTSVFGSKATTTVEIAADQPTRRAFVFYTYGTYGADGSVPMEQWEENGADVGSHPNAQPALTVEGLLAECRTILTKDPVANTLFLKVSDQGVPLACTSTNVQCIDDCTSGIRIESFACRNPP